jgi:hypothetical protein
VTRERGAPRFATGALLSANPESALPIHLATSAPRLPSIFVALCKKPALVKACLSKAHSRTAQIFLVHLHSLSACTPFALHQRAGPAHRQGRTALDQVLQDGHDLFIAFLLLRRSSLSGSCNAHDATTYAIIMRRMLPARASPQCAQGGYGGGRRAGEERQTEHRRSESRALRAAGTRKRTSLRTHLCMRTGAHQETVTANGHPLVSDNDSHLRADRGRELEQKATLRAAGTAGAGRSCTSRTILAAKLSPQRKKAPPKPSAPP